MWKLNEPELKCIIFLFFFFFNLVHTHKRSFWTLSERKPRVVLFMTRSLPIISILIFHKCLSLSKNRRCIPWVRYSALRLLTALQLVGQSGWNYSFIKGFFFFLLMLDFYFAVLSSCNDFNQSTNKCFLTNKKRRKYSDFYRCTSIDSRLNIFFKH